MTATEQAMRRLGTPTTADLSPDWDAVFVRELPRIYNYFRYRVGDDMAAEDLTAATFEKAWRARARYRRDLAACSTWLVAIARNVAADYFRRANSPRARAEIPLDLLHADADAETPERAYARQAELAQLSELLAQLSARERELVALKYGAQLTNREIAPMLRMTESNVGTSLQRIVAKLRARWRE